MVTKLFEIRDSMTFIPAIAICPQDGNPTEEERYLIRRVGYTGHPRILLSNLAGRGPMNCDPNDWTTNNTMRLAHKYIEEHWFTLVSGEVIDIEYIVGRTKTKKVSERVR